MTQALATRLTAFAFAAVFTAATLAGVTGVARTSVRTAALLVAQASAATAS